MDWEYLTVLGTNYLASIPVLAAWIIGVILSARMFKRDGGPAERLLLIGCCLMLAEKLFRPFHTVIMLWYNAEHAFDAHQYGLISLFTGIPFSLMSLAGIVCLIIAFWKRWQTNSPTPSKQEQAVLDQDTSGT